MSDWAQRSREPSSFCQIDLSCRNGSEKPLDASVCIYVNIVCSRFPRQAGHSHYGTADDNNKFSADTDAEVAVIKEYCRGFGVEAIECRHWAEGGKGAIELAEQVVHLADSEHSQFRPLYDDDLGLWEKARHIARTIYGADDIIADKKVRDQFHQFEDGGYGLYPVCMAKTQYSFSTDPNLLGAPKGHVVPIREIRLAAGAEFSML